MAMFKSAIAGTAMAATLVAAMAGQAYARQQCGTASWYALTSQTASGERANPNAMTAAHRSLPFGTVVRVTNERNGRSVNVRINDRGPFVGGRIIDVTRAAAHQLGFINAGTAKVCVVASNASAGTGRQTDSAPRRHNSERGCTTLACAGEITGQLR
jgi:rare lipoprotein A